MTLRPYSADLQQQFRATLGTPGAPEVIDDAQSVVPVAIVAATPQAVNVSLAETKRTVLCATATSSGGAGSTTALTVGAGRVARIVGMSIVVSGAARAQAVLNSVVFLNGISRTDSSAVSIQFDYETAPVLAATQTAVLTVTSAGNECALNVFYVDEAA